MFRNFQRNICETVVFHSRNLKLYEKDSQNPTLHKQSFTDVSEINIFKSLAKLTHKKTSTMVSF